MQNVILIGMPGCGKSTVGVVLAKALGMDFIDADLVIQRSAGKRLSALIDELGDEGFRQLENRVNAGIEAENTVIATGGSMVLSEGDMAHLKEHGVAVWLETPLSQISERIPEDLTDRGIAAPTGMDIRQIYRQRELLYAKYAYLIVASRPGEDDTTHQVEEVMRTVGMHL